MGRNVVVILCLTLLRIVPDNYEIRLYAKHAFIGQIVPTRYADRCAHAARTRSLASFLTVLAEGPEFLSEQLLFQGESARRGAKAFKRTTTKISELLQVLSGLAAQLTLASGLVLLVVFLAQHHPPVVAGVRGSLTFVDSFPHLDYLVWVLVLALILRAFVRLRSLNRRFARIESHSDGPS